MFWNGKDEPWIMPLRINSSPSIVNAVAAIDRVRRIQAGGGVRPGLSCVVSTADGSDFLDGSAFFDVSDIADWLRSDVATDDRTTS